jgi:hypothetical protein
VRRGTDVLGGLRAQNAALRERVAALMAEVEELKRRLGQKSNSSLCSDRTRVRPPERAMAAAVIWPSVGWFASRPRGSAPASSRGSRARRRRARSRWRKLLYTSTSAEPVVLEICGGRSRR